MARYTRNEIIIRTALLLVLVFFIPGLIVSGEALGVNSDHFFPIIFKNWPPPGQLLISEVLYDPVVGEPEGEWIEIYNHGGKPVELSAYKVGDEETPGEGEGMYQFPAGTSLKPYSVAVIANRAVEYYQMYGIYPDYEFQESDPYIPTMIKYKNWAGGSVSLSNTGDEVVLINELDELVDSVSWGASSFAFDPSVPGVGEGFSIERYPPSRDTDTSSDWRLQVDPSPGQLDLTPPTPTPEPTDIPLPTAIPTLVINEIHADPDPDFGDANNDGIVDTYEDEFIEIVNITGSAVNLSGWILIDAVTARHTFPENSIIPNQCAVVIFGGGEPIGEFGGSIVQVALTRVGFNTDGDTITLLDLSETAVSSYTYHSEGGDDQSLTRDPDIEGPELLVRHSIAEGSGGALYSPGTRVDGTPFIGCSTWISLWSD
jgi:hypothetical protein